LKGLNRPGYLEEKFSDPHIVTINGQSGITFDTTLGSTYGEIVFVEKDNTRIMVFTLAKMTS